jgi:hypothetical protein
VLELPRLSEDVPKHVPDLFGVEESGVREDGGEFSRGRGLADPEGTVQPDDHDVATAGGGAVTVGGTGIPASSRAQGTRAGRDIR